MIFEIEINNKPVKVKRGETIIEVLNRTGIKVPTLCSMKDYTPTGMCRMCVVEVEGRENLIPSCSFKVEEWMKIKTHSPRVVKARKALVELLLANHPDDCLFCERNGNCELQKHAEDLHVRERNILGHKNQPKIDTSSVSIVFDPAKCILCGRCIRVCNESIGNSTLDFSRRGIRTAVKTAMEKSFDNSNCIHCGQCIMVCPTAALSEKINFSELQVTLHDPSKKMVAVYSPAVAITLAEEFGIKASRELNAVFQTILRKIGFDWVIDSSLGTDLMIMETANELLKRVEEGGPFPMFSSCCPSWVKYLEQTEFSLHENLATTKSPQQLTGNLIKSYLSKKENLKKSDIIVVSVVPCTSRKYEATRPEMTIDKIADVDAVITTRELFRMIRMHGIDVSSIEPEAINNTFITNSTAGKLVNISGGTAESVIRSVFQLLKVENPDSLKTSVLRSQKGIKELKITIGKFEFGFAVVNGLNNVKQLLDEVKAGRKDLHYIEVMTCHGGCIAGGGQPIKAVDEDIKPKVKIITDADEKELVKTANQNSRLLEFFGNEIGINTSFKAVFSKKDLLV
jgi:iron-only hydrogenase group A